MQNALSSLSEDLAAARKFMLQTAQLGWLNHELNVENASGIRKMATASQELSASSARLEETMRQLSESLAGQLKELATRLDTIQGKVSTSSEAGDASRRHRRRCLCTLTACLLLSLIAVPDGLAGEWENMRESYDNTLRAHAKRIAEIEARERGVPADPQQRADKITRDRITGIKASLKGGGKARAWPTPRRRRPVTRRH